MMKKEALQLLLISSIIVLSQAQDHHCLEDGVLRKNNTWWKKNSCTSCFCSNNMVTCEREKCRDPQCNLAQGQAMVIPPSQCCPVCADAAKRHCEQSGVIIAHNTKWEIENCKECSCDDGDVICSIKRCPIRECGFGEILRRLPAHCCPQCISVEDSCTYGNRSYRDGETWSPSQCERLTCKNGEVISRVAQCKELVCRDGESLTLESGRCCPTCVGRSCIYQGRELTSGEQFNLDDCRSCVCQSGQVRCQPHHCNNTIDLLDTGCPSGERRVQRNGECCSECVSTQETCQYHGRRYFHGDLWNISKCEVALCSHGNIRSSIVQCSSVECKWNEKLVHTSCCPECVSVTSSCRHDDYEYRDGDSWQMGQCQVCECRNGAIQCFTADCPVCPANTVPVNVPGECCPDCQPVICHSDCLSCSAPGYGHCTSCPENRWLQGGKCVRRCMKGFFQDGKLCRDCHQSCRTCSSGNSPSLCTSCNAGALLQHGRCVPICEVGHFQQGRNCVACPQGCESCINSTQCLTCNDRTTIPQGGACVRECGRKYFFDNGICRACHPSCASCDDHSRHCQSCSGRKLLENGFCVDHCSPGNYQISISRCGACHSSCNTCSGTRDDQCLSCKENTFLYNGRCLDFCPPRHFGFDQECHACHSTCYSCTGPSSSQCTRCRDFDHVVQPQISEKHGVCQTACDEGFFVYDSLCKACSTSCASCENENSCTTCPDNFALLPAVSKSNGRQCVTGSQCNNKGLAVDFKTLLCYNATALSHCSTRGQSHVLLNGSCATSCPSGLYSKSMPSGSVCLACDHNCERCTRPGHCLKCKAGSFLSADGRTCVASCKFGFYQRNGQCTRCPDDCSSCSVSPTSPQPLCTSCIDANAVLQHGQCSTHCVQQFYPNRSAGDTPVCRECDWSCTACSGPGPNDCLECMEGYKLENGTCVAKCSKGFYESFERCLSCSDQHCQSCSAINQCSKCEEDYFLHGDKCVSSCPRGLFSDSSSGRCVACPSHCLSCSSATNCSQCDGETFRFIDTDLHSQGTKNHRLPSRRLPTNRRGEVCVRHCGRGYTSNKNTRQCQTNRYAPVISISGFLLPEIGSRHLVNTLAVSDRDTVDKDLIVTVMMQPANGWFELNRSRLSESNNQVSYLDIKRGNLWFVHGNRKKRRGVATFQASDGSLHSHVETMSIYAVPKAEPIVTKNNMLVLNSGESVKISARTCFNVTYQGPTSDLHLTLPYQPQHGKVVKLPDYQTPISTFKLSDLLSDTLLYVASGNMTTTRTVHDSIVVQISDGYHVTNKVINVNIAPQGNASSAVMANKGTHVRKGGLTRITNQHLLTIASNIKDKSNIVYVLRPRKREPRGKLVLMVPEMSDAPYQRGIGINEWIQNSQGQYQSPSLVRFTQRDIDEGYLWYNDQPSSDDEDEPLVEAFAYEVYDDSGPTSKPLGGSVLQINRIEENVAAPYISPGLSQPLQMTASEGMASVLHSGFLRYTDNDTPDRDIIYNITRPLAPALGHIESVDHPHVPISIFTQSDIDSNKIIYRPPVGGLRSIEQHLNYGRNQLTPSHAHSQHRSSTTTSSNRPKLILEFTVSDGEHVLNPTNFTINFLTKPSAPPVLANHLSILDVSQSGTATIGADQLSVSDYDTPLNELVFTLVKAPRYGNVIRSAFGSRIILRVGNTFTNDEIRRGLIRYSHSGDKTTPTDQIQISVTDGTNVIVGVIQVSILAADYSQAPSPDRFSELALNVEEDDEVILNRENLAYVDLDSEDNQLVYHVETEPFHGSLMKNLVSLVPGSTFTQDDINRGRIKFYSRSEIGNFPVSDMIHFHVTDAAGNTLSNQRLSITITPVRRQQSPIVTVAESVVVGFGKEVRLTIDDISVSDPDTSTHDLIVSVIQKPIRGNIINKRNEDVFQRNGDIWFRVSDLIEGFIYYAHSRDLGGNQDVFSFQVVDGHSTTATYTLNILIEMPHARPVLQSLPLVCRDGHAIIVNSDGLSVVDRDTPSRDLVFTITSSLQFGKLVKFTEKLPHDMSGGWRIGDMAGQKMKMKKTTELTSGTSFTYQDVLDQLICYENTISEPVSSSSGRVRRRREALEMVLRDGTSHQNVEMLIDIQPERVLQIKEAPPLTYLPPETREEFGNEELRSSERNQDPPEEEKLKMNETEITESTSDEMAGSDVVLTVNTGLHVEKGSITTITRNELRVSGTDHMVPFIITRDPNVGKLQYAKNDIVADLSAKGDNEFTQEEIDEGSIRYNHPISQGGGDVFFMFDIIGGKIDNRFNIHVREDRQPPSINTNREISVQEGESVIITTEQLSAADESGRLVYEITEPTRLGRIELTNGSGSAITRFTQADLSSGLVRYVHTSDTKRTKDQFTFSLTDGSNAVLHTFVIRVELVDNSLPVVVNLGVRVQEGVRKTITDFDLKAIDRDTNNDRIRFIITVAPQHGSLDRSNGGSRYVPVTSFTMADIYESRVSYNHDGTNSLSDTFSFKVSDGTNDEFKVTSDDGLITTTEPQLFQIQVVPVDDGTPRLITNLGLNHLEYVEGKALGVIEKRALLTEDPDTEPDQIIYSVTSDPRHGYLESTLNEGRLLRTFSQADINSGLIRYVLSNVSTTTVTRDSFMFNVRDSLPNFVKGNAFNIKWSVISFDKSNYTVNEEASSVDVVVQRRGNLNQYAIVLCRTEHGNATSLIGSSFQRGKLDYTEHSGQVQFDVYETEKVCSIQINDDSVYEGRESFTVELSMPTYSLLGNITKTTVYINDDHDIPTIQFLGTQFTEEESDAVIHVPIKRTGDIQKPVTVVCYTESKTATGSRGGRIESGDDYISRDRRSTQSVVTFSPGSSQANCDVTIFDDSLYEDSEEFTLKIVSPSDGAKIGKFSEATVTITGPNDSPTVFLTNNNFLFSETAGTVDIPVHRSGTDLSMATDVWCSTKQTDPPSALAGEDFVATATKISFRPEETAKICSLTILDDSQNPTVEGNETFVVHLNSIQSASLSSPHEAQVIISDTFDDVPTFQFLESSVEVKENSGFVALPIQRVGDVSSRASVLCYTRQDSALAEEDFVERSRTQLSRITFSVGQRVSQCNVSLVDDGIYEASERFAVRLADAAGQEWYGAKVGENNVVSVTVTDDEDAPTLQFELSEYSIREPDTVDSTRRLTVTVVRTGDPSDVSKVRCSTRDGSAKSGDDYEPKSRLLRFQPGQTEVTFEVDILANEDTEWHETFLIVLGPQEPVNAVLGEKFQTTVTILDKDAAGSLVLPSTPVVVSLLHYDDVALGLKSDPSPGYPIVCVTPCDPRYPDYAETRNLCEEAAINASAIRFSWEVAMPADEQNSVPPFETVADETPFTSVNTKVLDSVYFGRRFNVRCVAQAVDSLTKTGGTPLRSNVVTIATNSGLCHNPIVSGSNRNFQAQSFIANLNYISDDEQHPNTLHISVKIPHQDGRLPLISTMPLNNLKLLLSRSIDRQQHVCSNLVFIENKNVTLTTDDDSTLGVGSDLSFIESTDYSKLSLGPGYDKPYQFDPSVREAKTIDLYKHLNLKSCMWQFDAYYHMNELIDHCNGRVDSDFQVRDAAESQVTVTVPLYVSYVYVTAPRGWGALEHQTEMEVSFRYQNVLWRTGIQTDGVLSGRIQVERIKIREDGKLVIKFKTQAKYRGLFVQSHRTLPTKKARVVPPEGMNIAFELTNLWSEHTYDSPYQHWQAVSTYSRKDYSGQYSIELLPCVVSPTQKWAPTLPGQTVPCTASAPEKFEIPIMFQQTNRPVPVVYTLQTDFQLYNNEKVFMMDPRSYDQEMSDYDYKGSYTKGQTIFGRVLWTPEQDLKSAYRLQLDKVYLCTGKDGYVPYFDPTGEIYGNGPQHGCIKPSKNLQHRFLLLDRSNRDAEDRYFHDISFDAFFASDRSEFAAMSDLPGVDGFCLKVDALYKVEAGHQWYLQVLYVIGSEKALPRVKRSAMFDVSRGKIRSRRKRSDSSGNLKNPRFSDKWRKGTKAQNGTNMRGIEIDQSELSDSKMILIAAVAGSAGFLVLVGLVMCVCCFCGFCGCRKRKKKEKEADEAMLALKTIAIEKERGINDDDDEYSAEKNPNLVKVTTTDKYNKKYSNKTDYNSVEAPLMKQSYKDQKPNNVRDYEKPLLKSNRRKNVDLKFVNNLKEKSDSGTEV